MGIGHLNIDRDMKLQIKFVEFEGEYLSIKDTNIRNKLQTNFMENVNKSESVSDEDLCKAWMRIIAADAGMSIPKSDSHS
jgi:hypothetical protein